MSRSSEEPHEEPHQESMLAAGTLVGLGLGSVVWGLLSVVRGVMQLDAKELAWDVGLLLSGALLLVGGLIATRLARQPDEESPVDPGEDGPPSGPLGNLGARG